MLIRHRAKVICSDSSHLNVPCLGQFVLMLACVSIITGCSVPLGDPRWSFNKAEDSNSTYRLAVLTYDENGIAQAPKKQAVSLNSSQNPRMQDSNFKNRVSSRLPSTCVYSEIVQFLKSVSPENSLVDSGSLSEEDCNLIMTSDVPEAQSQSFTDFIKSAQTLTMVVFVHGWKNTADENNNNLLQFKKLLGNLATEIDSQKHKVYGIYLGWPGADYKEPLQTLRFWDRKRTADEVSRTDLQIDLLRLQKLWRVDRDLLKGNRNCVGLLCQTLRLVVTGHSFGARIVFNIVQPYFIDGALSSSIVVQGEDGGPIQLALACKSTRDQTCRPLDSSAEQQEYPRPISPRAIYNEGADELSIRCNDTAQCNALFFRIRRAVNSSSDKIRIPADLIQLSNQELNPISTTETSAGFVKLGDAEITVSENLEIQYADGSATYVPIEDTASTPSGISATSQIDGFGDMVVLLNPAFEASRFLPLTEIQDAHAFKPESRNALVVLSSENDTATKTAFPFAKGLESGFGGGENGRLARATVGNYESNVFTMRNTKLTTTKSDNSEFCGSIEEERVLPSMCNEGNLSNINKTWCEAQKSKILPFMVASTPKTFMNGHSDVFNQCVADYLTRIVTKKLIQ